MQISKTVENKQRIPALVWPSGNNWQPLESSKGTIMETGPQEEILQKISSAIDQAKDMVCVQSFLMQESAIFEALGRAQERGVKVFITGAAEARLQQAFEEDEDYRTEDFKKMLQTCFKGKFLFRSAPSFHAKYLLVDPRGPLPIGFICTQNFCKKPFSENPELTVLLNPDQCMELYKVFVYHFWEETEQEQGSQDDFTTIQAAGHFQFPELKDIILTTPAKGQANLPSKLSEAIEAAQATIQLSTYSIEGELDLVKHIQNKAASGLLVRVFCQLKDSNLPALRLLAESGAEVILQEKLHAKFLLVDEEQGFIFSANYTRQSFGNGHEVGLSLNPPQVLELAALADRWARDFPYQIKVDLPLLDCPKEFREINNKGELAWRKVSPNGQDQRNFPIKTSKDVERAYRKLEDLKPAPYQVKMTQELTLKFDRPPQEYKMVETVRHGLERIEYETGKKKKKTHQALLVKPATKPEHLRDLPDEFREMKLFSTAPPS